MQQLTNIQELEMAIDKNGEMVVSKNSKNNVIIMSMEEYNQKFVEYNKKSIGKSIYGNTKSNKTTK